MEVEEQQRSGGGFTLDRRTSGDVVKRILVVDDEASIRVMLQAVLLRKGYDVATAADGEDALTKLHNYNPDVVLLDLMMPKFDGWKFLKVLRAHCDALGIRVPHVIVVSAHLRINPQEVLGLGAAALVTKPFDNDELYTLLRHLTSPVAV